MVYFYSIYILYLSRYNTSTGVFTVPPGAGGMYYFSVFMQIDYHTKGVFKLRLNDDTQCRARGDSDGANAGDTGMYSRLGFCSQYFTL